MKKVVVGWGRMGVNNPDLQCRMWLIGYDISRQNGVQAFKTRPSYPVQ